MIPGLNSWLRFVLAVALLVGTGLLLHARRNAEVLPPRKDLASLPERLGEWTGEDVGIHPDVLAALGPGEFLSRIYRRGTARPVELFMAYFASQRTGDTIHSPKNCLPGSGWAPVQSFRLGLRRSDGRTVFVNRYIIAKGADRMLVLYWYQAHGRIVASEYWAKIFLVADAIRMNRSDGALVRIITPIAWGEDPDLAQRRAVEFAKALLPLLGDYIPR